MINWKARGSKEPGHSSATAELEKSRGNMS